MATIRFKTGKSKQLPEPVARKVWACMAGLRTPNTSQAVFCAAVKKVSLNWRNAPDEYIRRNLDEIIPLALAEWAVDKQGRPVRPATPQAWVFAKKWGLWRGGQPTNRTHIRRSTPVQLEIVSGV